MALESIDYKKVFFYFEEISKIPRGSRNMEAISNYFVKFARERGLYVRQDEAYNVIIKKKASQGYESLPPVMLQGHMDMVCEKESFVEHDFSHEGLKLTIDGDFIFANGTTLGGDDGIFLAYALAILSDSSLKHPELEIVITTDEEIGMDGAAFLDCSDLKSKYLINLDSEEEGILLTSCAGGLHSVITIPISFDLKEGIPIIIEIKGLKGGHSGTEIHKNRANAILLMNRLLKELEEQQVNYDLSMLQGGAKDNAIPREAKAVILTEEPEKAEERIREEIKKYQKELELSEPFLEISVKREERTSKKILTKEGKEKILFFLTYAPNGVQTMSSAIDGLVESSLNLGIIKLQDDQAQFTYAIRSSVHSYLDFIHLKLRYLAESLGGTDRAMGRYPAWEYRKDSKLRDLCISQYQKIFQKPMKVAAIHAGLECGLLAGKLKDLDIVSFGPEMKDIHTPKERMSISSAKRVYDYLISVLEDMDTLIEG